MDVKPIKPARPVATVPDSIGSADAHQRPVETGDATIGNTVRHAYGSHASTGCHCTAIASYALATRAIADIYWLTNGRSANVKSAIAKSDHGSLDHGRTDHGWTANNRLANGWLVNGRPATWWQCLHPRQLHGWHQGQGVGCLVWQLQLCLARPEVCFTDGPAIYRPATRNELWS